MKAVLAHQMSHIIRLTIFFAALDETISVFQQTLTKPLRDDLFTNYDTNLLPICNEGENVTVKIDLALRQVMELDEPRQILNTNVWIRLTWNDCRLKWNTSLYGNLTDLTVMYDDVWFPDITLVDSAAEEVMFPGREFFSAHITSSGSVSYNFPTILTSVCRVNVRYFPFDYQRCPLSFASWSYHGEHLDIIYKNPTGDIDTFVENSEWNLEKIPAARKVLYYNCCSEPYPDVTFYVVLKRRPAFYVLTMLFPCILVSLVSALTFILPTESGEKVSLEITVLLSLGVFLLVVSEALPPASDNFPIIGYYFATAMVLVSISLLQTILILNVFHRGANGRKVPKWLKTVCFQYLARIVCANQKASENKGHNHTYEPQSNSKEDTYVDIRPKSKTIINIGPSKIDGSFVSNLVKNGGQSSTDTPYKKKNNRHLHKRLPRSEDTISKLLRDLDVKLNFMVSTVHRKTDGDDINSEWRDVANILDKIFLLLYCLLIFITALVFLSYLM